MFTFGARVRPSSGLGRGLFHLRRRLVIGLNEIPGRQLFQNVPITDSIYAGKRPDHLSFLANVSVPKYAYTENNARLPVSSLVTDTWAHWDVALLADASGNMTYNAAESAPAPLQLVVLATSLCTNRAVDDFFLDWCIEHKDGTRTPLVQGYNGPSCITTLHPDDGFCIRYLGENTIQWLGDEPCFRIFKVVYS